MKRKRAYLVFAALLIGALAASLPQGALAAGTPACTQITNSATVNYQVGGVSQNPVTSNTASFYVGVKVDVQVVTTDVAPVSVTPGAANTAIHFRVTNNGNAPQKYELTAIAAANGTANPFGAGADSFDGTNYYTYGVAGANASIANLAAGANVPVTLTMNTPLTTTNGQLAVMALKAQTQWVGSTTSITVKNGTATGATINDGALCTALGATVIDVVAGDGAGSDDAANDGAYSARSAFQVSSAALTITKTSVVYWDPVNLLVGPKAIPGAVVTYTVNIVNNGTSNATSVQMTDNMTAQMPNLTWGNGTTGAPNASFNDGVNNCTGSGAGYGIVVNGTCKTDAGDADGADWNSTTANAVTVTGLTVASGGGSATIKYQLTIK